jgi:hypothetical protein
VFLLEAIADKGNVTEEIVEAGRKLHFELEKSQDRSLLSHPKVEHLRSVLKLYNDAVAIRLFLKARWRNLIADKRKKPLFRSLPKLVVEDYQYFGENGINELINTHVKIPNILTRPESVGFGYFPLVIFFVTTLIEELFVALIQEGENPKAYPEVFTGIQKRFCGVDESGNRIMETVLERAKKRA